MFCEECGHFVDEDDALSIMNAGVADVCPDCFNDLESGDSALDGEAWFCEVCDTELEFGDPTCRGCSATYGFTYWEAELNEFYSRWRRPSSVVDGEDTYFYNLCCNEHMSDCKCEHPIEFNDREIPQDVREQAYLFDSKCSSCVMFYTAQCLPYRAWLFEILSTGEKPTTAIDVCSYYVGDPRCVDNQVGRDMDDEYYAYAPF